MRNGKLDQRNRRTDRKLRVLIDGCIFNYQTSGGISKLWAGILYEWSKREDVDLALVLASRNKNIHLRVATLPATIRRFREPIRRPIYLVSNPVYRGMFLANVQKAYGPFDIFHSSFYSMPSRTEVPGVITVHDLIDEIYSKSNRGGIFSKLHLHTKKDTIRRAAGLVAVSEATKSDLRKYYPECAEIPVYVCPNAADDLFKCQGGELGSRSQKSKNIVHVGKRGGYKNFRVLIDALSCINTRGYLLQIVGGESFSVEESRLLGKARVQYEVLGEIPDDKLATVYRNAFCLVSASRNEGFGIPIIEAMASGCPVVCSDIPPHREVTKGIAVFFDPDDPRELLRALDSLDNADLRWSNIQRGWEHAVARSFSDVASELLAVYRNILNDSVSTRKDYRGEGR